MNSVAVITHHDFEARLAVIRAEADERHAERAAVARQDIDARIAELVRYRILQTADAMLAPPAP